MIRFATLAAFALVVSACGVLGVGDDATGTASGTAVGAADTGAGAGEDGGDGGITLNVDDADDGSETDEAAMMPAFIWGVEDETFDLVRIDTATGDEVQRIAGWGVEAADPGREGGAQVLQYVTAEAGQVWVDDCCEPAAGNVFRVDPSTPAGGAAVPETEIRINGLTPTLSPDGSLVAVSVLDIGIAVHDAVTGEQIVDPTAAGTVLGLPDPDGPVFPRALTWLDDNTIAVSVGNDEASTMVGLSVAVPSAPSLVGTEIAIDGRVIDAATQSDGSLAIAVAPVDGEPFGAVYSLDDGSEPAVFALDPAVSSLDYDSGGDYLLVSRDGQPPTWQGLGQTGVIGDSSLVSAAWADGGAVGEVVTGSSNPDQDGEADDSGDDAGGDAVDDTTSNGDPAAEGDGVEPIVVSTVSRAAIDEAGLEGIGCYFHPGTLDLEPVFHASYDGKITVIDGEVTVFDLGIADGEWDLEPIANAGSDVLRGLTCCGV